MITLQASTYLDPKGLIVESAELLAGALVANLNDGNDIEVVLAGIRGIPSSYFNVILLRLLDDFGVEQVKNRVTFRFDTDVQRMVFQRSFDAASKALE